MYVCVCVCVCVHVCVRENQGEQDGKLLTVSPELRVGHVIM